ncbi:hypothetical protein MycrhN_0454 [Mycolicibacterium rhodesiae NBB3]|jgi:hypothetical protein|uniref:Uncharacterized protein n=1 Tax=Mycolicibacterium rhodesiae (strain NBB3) TaxID=710685 RepID=G8RL31_MYCRN|nr:hypothetical protein [Mycolicibacterium rhodesiae]AEV71093.1 hypothetical protein MycrhN_0454 [Mycolicibacterium rhodesiae NBB3]
MREPDGVISYPGHTGEMTQRPRDEMRDYVAACCSRPRESGDIAARS